MFAPASAGANSIRNLSILILVITGFIFLLVEGMLIYATFRFRQPAAQAPGASGKEPRQVHGSKPIEIAWTAAPALIELVLLMVTIRTIWDVNPTPPPPQSGDHALFVTAISHQWWWEYRYEHFDSREFGFVTANERHIPAGANGIAYPVYLTLRSTDVCHSYWVPGSRGRPT